MAVTVYNMEGDSTVGVPEIVPVVGLRVRPTGRLGEMVYTEAALLPVGGGIAMGASAVKVIVVASPV